MHINKEYWYVNQYHFSNNIWFIWWTRLILLTLYTLSGYFDMSERHIVSFCASHLKMLRQWVCTLLWVLSVERENPNESYSHLFKRLCYTGISSLQMLSLSPKYTMEFIKTSSNGWFWNSTNLDILSNSLNTMLKLQTNFKLYPNSSYWKVK